MKQKSILAGKIGILLLMMLVFSSVLANGVLADANGLNSLALTSFWTANNSSSLKVTDGEQAELLTYVSSTENFKLWIEVIDPSTNSVVKTVVDGKEVSSSTISLPDIQVFSIDTTNLGLILPKQYYVRVHVLNSKESEDVFLNLTVQKNNNIVIDKVPEDIPKDTNFKPVMNDLPDQKVQEGTKLSFTVSAYDKNVLNNLIYQAKVCKYNFFGFCIYVPVTEIGATFQTKSNVLYQEYGQFTWTPNYDEVQHPALQKELSVRFRAYDGQEYSNWEYATITVTDKNRNPNFDPISDKTVEEGAVLQFTVTATDADKDALVYSISKAHLPSGSYSMDQSGHFTFSPDLDDAGKYLVTFWVEDKFGGNAFKTIGITVTDKRVDNEPECNDGIDNDNDELVDMQDPGCSNPEDDDEKDDPVANRQCKDKIDNDNDQLVDTQDPGCHTDGDANNPGSYNPQDNDESNDPVLPQCKDGKDNDYDGYIDIADPGCSGPEDNDESDDPVPPQCKDGKDNDGDTLVDFPADPGCDNQQDNDESNDPVPVPQCEDGSDNDNDGKIDETDPGCHTDGNPDNFNSYNPKDNDERNDLVLPQCKDGKDNDNDGAIDGRDPGCHTDGNANNPGSYNPQDNDEGNDPVLPQCKDGKDNDNDGYIDLADPGCSSSEDNDESNQIIPPVDNSGSRLNIKLQSVHLEHEFVGSGSTLFVNVRLFNNGEEDLKNLKVQAKIYDLGVMGSTGKFTLKSDKGTDKNVYVFIPEGVQPGLYLVKVTVGNSQYHTSSYRVVNVDVEGHTIR